MEHQTLKLDDWRERYEAAQIAIKRQHGIVWHIRREMILAMEAFGRNGDYKSAQQCVNMWANFHPEEKSDTALGDFLMAYNRHRVPVDNRENWGFDISYLLSWYGVDDITITFRDADTIVVETPKGTVVFAHGMKQPA